MINEIDISSILRDYQDRSKEMEEFFESPKFAKLLNEIYEAIKDGVDVNVDSVKYNLGEYFSKELQEEWDNVINAISHCCNEEDVEYYDFGYKYEGLVFEFMIGQGTFVTVRKDEE